MAALTQRDSVKIQGGISLLDSTKDKQINSLISGISDLVLNSLHRNIPQDTYTEYQSGNNSEVLQLKNFPIQSVSRVCIDENGNFGQTPGAFAASGDLVAGVDYSIMAGRNGIGSTGCLRRINGLWLNRYSRSWGSVAPQPSSPRGNILVVYVAGYSPVPPGIVYAVNSAILNTMKMQKLGGMMQSGAYEDASISLVSPADLAKVFGSVERSLGSYRMPVV